MVRCSITTKTKKRCRNHALENKTMCYIHAFSHDDDEQFIPVNTITDSNLPLYDNNKTKECSHTCAYSTPNCCICSDIRDSSQNGYIKYVDRLGDTLLGFRHDNYCNICKSKYKLASQYHTYIHELISKRKMVNTLASKTALYHEVNNVYKLINEDINELKQLANDVLDVFVA